MTFHLTPPQPAPSLSYDDRKQTGTCARAGCDEPCQEEHLLCDGHAEEHRERNVRAKRRLYYYRKRQLRLAIR